MKMMTREDYLWVVIKGIGVFLIIRALMALPDLLAAGGALLSLEDPIMKSKLAAGISSQMKYTLGLKFLAVMTKVILYFLVGKYMLKSGQIFFFWIGDSKPDLLDWRDSKRKADVEQNVSATGADQ